MNTQTESDQPDRAAQPAQTEHTAAPWRVNAVTGIVTRDGIHVTEVRGYGLTPEQNAANARRVAACVNACAGLALPDGVPVGALADRLAALRAVESRLTAAANAFYISGKPKDLQAALSGWRDDAQQARSAIAAAEGRVQS